MAKKPKEPKARITWHHERLTLDDLYRLQHNPRRPDEKGRADLKKSLDRFGVAVPLTLNMDHVIIGGHQRLDELSAAGDEFADCWVCDVLLSPEQVDELCVRLNKNTAGVWDGDLLAEYFSAEDLQQWGFEARELEEMDGVNLSTQGDDLSGMSSSSSSEGDETDPRLADLPTVSQLGDLFELRTADGLVHRVRCGSSTRRDEVYRLFGGKKAAMVCTDMPYGVDYQGTLTKQRDGIKNDTDVEYNDFFFDYITAVPCEDYNTWYMFMSDQELHTLRQAWDRAGGYWSSYLLWIKNHFVLGRKDYNPQHEQILYGWMGKHEFHGEMSARTLFDYDNDPEELPVEELMRQVREFKQHFSTVLRFDKPSKNPYHPTMKPVELIGRLLRDGSEARAICYDGCLGSGTHLLACEKYNRTAYCQELDPYYVDIALGRYCQWMDQNGRTFELVHLEDADSCLTGNGPLEPKSIGHFLQALEDRLGGTSE